MTNVNILNEREIRAYETAPVFQAQQRKQFFTLPNSLQQQLQSFHTPTNKVCFSLLFGYFKATGRFFSPTQFRQKDIEFICGRLGFLSFAVDIKTYSRETISRHKKIILKHFAYQAFEANRHEAELREHIQKMIESQFRPKLIFDFMVDWLTHKRVELPSYHRLQRIIAEGIKSYDQQVLDRMKEHLNDQHCRVLDPLLEYSKHSHLYLLTWLKYFDPTDSYKHIQANVERLKTIQAIFEVIAPLITTLNLNTHAIRHYGELAVHYSVYQLNRRAQLSRYLYLLSFIAYQRYQFEDGLMDTLLGKCRSVFNQAEKAYKESLINTYQLTKPIVKKVFNGYYEVLQRQEKAIHILWSDTNRSAPQKIQLLRQLFPPPQEDQQDQQTIQQLQQQYISSDQTTPYDVLESFSLSLQKQVASIISVLSFNTHQSSTTLVNAIQNFRDKQGTITPNDPMDFLSDDDRKEIFDETGKFRISLFKMLLFKAVERAVRDGSLHLKYSFRYKAYDDYLIKEKHWQTQKSSLLQRASFSHLSACSPLLEHFKTAIHQAYCSTNESIQLGQNKFMRFGTQGKFSIKTPKSEVAQTEAMSDLFPNTKIIPLSEVLATVQYFTNYLDHFVHLQSKYQKQRPSPALFYAGLTAYGCNLGIPTMTKVAMPIAEKALENTVNWYFDLKHINQANDTIVEFMARLDLPQVYKQHKDQLHTSSDGQKFEVKGNSIYATYSYKYFGKAKGVSAYAYTDERHLQFYSTVINASEREATYVIDGLLHNEVVQSTIHSTDTHGYTEAIFALMHLLGFEFAPRIAKIYKQRIYSFEKKAVYQELDYKILPNAYINTSLIEDNWDSILRLITSIKLKECTASQIFKRLNSYTRQHTVYQALKEYGKIVKTRFILQYIDNVELRQSIRKQLNKIEQSNKFSAAICFANNGELIFPTRQEQLIAESCKRLIKNAIICWNYLYLTQCIQQAPSVERKRQILERIKAGSAMTWKHIYFHGLYDFSDEKLNNSFNIDTSQNFDLDLPQIMGARK